MILELSLFAEQKADIFCNWVLKPFLPSFQYLFVPPLYIIIISYSVPFWCSAPLHHSVIKPETSLKNGGKVQRGRGKLCSWLLLLQRCFVLWTISCRKNKVGAPDTLVNLWLIWPTFVYSHSKGNSLCLHCSSQTFCCLFFFFFFFFFDKSSICLSVCLQCFPPRRGLIELLLLQTVFYLFTLLWSNNKQCLGKKSWQQTFGLILFFFYWPICWAVVSGLLISVWKYFWAV